MIIAGSSNLKLAESIAARLSVPLVESITRKFEDQELHVKIKGGVNGKNVAIVQSISKPVNDNLMELLLLIDAAKRAGAGRITVVIPYFGYSRQDRAYAGEAVSMNVVASMLNAAKINDLITADLHSEPAEGLFKMKVHILGMQPLFAEVFKEKDGYIVISPDVGGSARAKDFADLLGLELVVLNKKRLSNGKCIIEGDVAQALNKHCIIVDDIVDSGETLCTAAALLTERGVLSVTACATHAVISSSFIEKLEAVPIAKLYVTDSIYHSRLDSRIHVIQTADMFAKTLRDIIV